MNLPIVLIGAVGVFFLLNKKKTTISKVKEITPKDDDIDGKDVVEPDNKPPKDDEVKLPENPIYSELTKGRIGLINSFINDLPLKINPKIADVYIPVDPALLDYSKWIIANPKGLYQGWLATMVYWTIAIKENKWDLGSGELPLMFTPAKKFEVATIEPPTYKFSPFPETPQQADLRLAKGRKLWLEINEYIMNNLKICPNGAYCGPIIQKI